MGFGFAKVFLLTVDSGASDTIVPPHVARNLLSSHPSKVGIEYEVANGGVIVNECERRAAVKTKMGSEASLIMSCQFVEVHKPLLAVSRLVEAGNLFLFGKIDPHIILSTGGKVGITCTGGIYYIDLWIKNPGFTRQILR